MKKNKTLAVRWLAACLALLLVGGGSGVIYQQAYAVTSVVSLDVNPSIELSVNRNEKVLSCTALNERAAEVLADMGGGADLKGTKLDVAVNAIVGSLVRCGYLDNVSSAILISVEDKDQDRAAKLQEELIGVVDSLLQESSANAAVLSQTVTKDTELEQQAKENNISTGKAALIEQVRAINSDLKFEALAALSVEEIKDLIETGVPGMPIGKDAAIEAAEKYAGVQTAELKSSKADPELDESPACYEVELHHPTLGKFEYKINAYTGEVLSGQPDILKLSAAGNAQITAEKAQEIALAHKSANYSALKQYDAENLSVKSDKEDDRPIYEVKFTCGGYKFEYEIDAVTGAVLDWDSNYKEETKKNTAADTSSKTETSGSSSGTSASSYIGESAAKTAALSHAGVKESDTKYCNAWLSYDGGRAKCYEVQFQTKDTDYEYEIDLYDGSVLKYKSQTHRESGDASNGSSGGSSGTSSASYIGESAAKTAALNHAGVKESDTKYCNVWLEYDDGRPECYEVEFKVNGVQYEYEIDLYSGAVLKYESEDHGAFSGTSDAAKEEKSDRNGENESKKQNGGSESNAAIQESEAKSIALNHAGVTESQASKLKVELEDEHGQPEYEVEFKSGNIEYEYKIDGVTGEILKFETDRDD